MMNCLFTLMKLSAEHWWSLLTVQSFTCISDGWWMIKWNQMDAYLTPLLLFLLRFFIQKLQTSRIWSQDFHRTQGNRDSSLGGHKQSLECTKTQRKGAVTPQETEPKLPSSVGGSPVEAVGKGSPQEWGNWQQLFEKVPFGISRSWSLPLTLP